MSFNVCDTTILLPRAFIRVYTYIPAVQIIPIEFTLPVICTTLILIELSRETSVDGRLGYRRAISGCLRSR